MEKTLLKNVKKFGKIQCSENYLLSIYSEAKSNLSFSAWLYKFQLDNNLTIHETKNRKHNLTLFELRYGHIHEKNN